MPGGMRATKQLLAASRGAHRCNSTRGGTLVRNLRPTSVQSTDAVTHLSRAATCRSSLLWFACPAAGPPLIRVGMPPPLDDVPDPLEGLDHRCSAPAPAPAPECVRPPLWGRGSTRCPASSMCSSSAGSGTVPDDDRSFGDGGCKNVLCSGCCCGDSTRFGRNRLGGGDIGGSATGEAVGEVTELELVGWGPGERRGEGEPLGPPSFTAAMCCCSAAARMEASLRSAGQLPA